MQFIGGIMIDIFMRYQFLNSHQLEYFIHIPSFFLILKKIIRVEDSPFSSGPTSFDKVELLTNASSVFDHLLSSSYIEDTTCCTGYFVFKGNDEANNEVVINYD